MKITRLVVEVIPQDRQRYDTLGDYWQDPDGTLQIRITEMADWRYVWLVLMHELAEYGLCLHRGISEPDIMAFDIAWEARNTDPNAEPGNDPEAPYYFEHGFAENEIERPMAEALEVDWDQYATYCAGLCEAMGRIT